MPLSFTPFALLRKASQPQGWSKPTETYLPTGFWKDWRVCSLKEWPLARHRMLAAGVKALCMNASS